MRLLSLTIPNQFVTCIAGCAVFNLEIPWNMWSNMLYGVRCAFDHLLSRKLCKMIAVFFQNLSLMPTIIIIESEFKEERWNGKMKKICSRFHSSACHLNRWCFVCISQLQFYLWLRLSAIIMRMHLLRVTLIL